MPTLINNISSHIYLIYYLKSEHIPPTGQIIKPAAMPSSHFIPPKTLSMWEYKNLENGQNNIKFIQSLVPILQNYQYCSIVMAGEIYKISPNISIDYDVDPTHHQTIRYWHIGIGGITKQLRRQLLALLTQYIQKI